MFGICHSIHFLQVLYSIHFSHHIIISSFFICSFKLESIIFFTSSLTSFLVIIFFPFIIFLIIDEGFTEKFQTCSIILFLSSKSFSLSSNTLKTDNSLSKRGNHIFSKYLFNILFHLSRCISLFSLFKKLLILSFALVVFTKDNQKGLGFFVLSVTIWTTSQLLSSLSKG